MTTIAANPVVSIAGSMYIVTIDLMEGAVVLETITVQVHKDRSNADKLSLCVAQARAQKAAFDAKETARRAAQTALNNSNFLAQVNA